MTRRAVYWSPLKPDRFWHDYSLKIKSKSIPRDQWPHGGRQSQNPSFQIPIKVNSKALFKQSKPAQGASITSDFGFVNWTSSSLPEGRLQVRPFPLEGSLHAQLNDPTVLVQEASELWQSSVPLVHSSISGNGRITICIITPILQRGGRRERKRSKIT